MAQNVEPGKILYSWEAPEYEKTTRSPTWYVVAAVVVVLVIAYGIYARQWSLIAVTLVAAGALYFVGARTPKTFAHKIFDNGVEVGDKFYPFDQLKSFWIIADEDSQTLNLLQLGKFKFLLSLQLGDADVEKIRTSLVQFLPEETDREPDMIDKISRFLKL